MTESLAAGVLADAQTLWDYHRLDHDLRPTDVGIGFGSHDLGVAIHTVDLFHAGYFPLIVFTGANAPTTVETFPRGEAVHYTEEAIRRGVDPQRILTEPNATNTGENITMSRDLLTDHGITPSSATVVTRPYQQRRAYATFLRVWPSLDVVCSSERIGLDEYLDQIGDPGKVVNMLVGDTQRIEVYAHRGFAAEQLMPQSVRGALQRLIEAGYISRLI